MTVTRWEGTATATTSLMHGGELLGTTTYLRREAFLTPQGTRINIPVVSGNAVRGALRDFSAHRTWEALGQPELPMPVMHALWSGGALVKSKTQPLTGQRLAQLRATVPHVGVFGASGGGRIIDGCTTIGKLLPLCQQTAHLIPEHLHTQYGGNLPDIHDLLQIEMYSRTHDNQRASYATNPAAADADTDHRMRYGTETFIPGTIFHAVFTLNHPADVERDYFTELLTDWSAVATVGGRLARGHGHLALNLAANPTPPSPTTNWRTFNGATLGETLTMLNWLD